MFTYEYVSVERENAGVMGVQAIFIEHREIIDVQAKKGYRYVGYMPTKIHPNGKFIEMDLIFEKQE